MTGPHRRVVVGTTPEQKSTIVLDDLIPADSLVPRGNLLTQLWAGDEPARLPASADARAETPSFLPRPGGWRFSILTFMPDSTMPLEQGSGRALPDLGAFMRAGGGNGMHATPTIDLIYVVSGELWLELDDGVETCLRAGDSVVQNGTRHGWRNKSASPATMVLTMLGADTSRDR